MNKTSKIESFNQLARRIHKQLSIARIDSENYRVDDRDTRIRVNIYSETQTNAVYILTCALFQIRHNRDLEVGLICHDTEQTYFDIIFQS